jgi:hypothetical protein
MDPKGIPKMRSLPQLLIDHQHLQQNIDGTPICLKQMQDLHRGASSRSRGQGGAGEDSAAAAAAAAPASSSASSRISAVGSSPEDDLAAALRAAMLSKQPGSSAHWVRDEFESRLCALSIPEFYDQCSLGSPSTQEQLDAQLRRRQYLLKVQTAHLESQLLAEAGTYVSTKTGREFTFPPCSQGAACVGMTQRMRMQDRPFILTMVMFDFEYEYFINTGEPPKASRPCVACSRHYIASCTVFDRAVRMCGEGQDGDTVLAVQRSGTQPRQFYQNLRDQPGGYHSIHMLVSTNNRDDPIIEPICLPGRSVLFCVPSRVLINKETGRPRMVVDQTAIVWNAPRAPQISIGQNLLSFCGGASKI